MRINLLLEDMSLAVHFMAVMKQFIKLSPKIKCLFEERL